MSDNETYTYHDLKQKKVVELREIAKGIEHDAVQGYTQLNKEHLLVAICKALDIDTFEHHKAVGVDKVKLKKQIKKLKQKRDDAAAAKDYPQHKFAIRAIHRLKRKLHNATV